MITLVNICLISLTQTLKDNWSNMQCVIILVNICLISLTQTLCYILYFSVIVTQYNPVNVFSFYKGNVYNYVNSIDNSFSPVTIFKLSPQVTICLVGPADWPDMFYIKGSVTLALTA